MRGTAGTGAHHRVPENRVRYVRLCAASPTTRIAAGPICVPPADVCHRPRNLSCRSNAAIAIRRGDGRFRRLQAAIRHQAARAREASTQPRPTGIRLSWRRTERTARQARRNNGARTAGHLPTPLAPTPPPRVGAETGARMIRYPCRQDCSPWRRPRRPDPAMVLMARPAVLVGHRARPGSAAAHPARLPIAPKRTADSSLAVSLVPADLAGSGRSCTPRSDGAATRPYPGAPGQPTPERILPWRSGFSIRRSIAGLDPACSNDRRCSP